MFLSPTPPPDPRHLGTWDLLHARHMFYHELSLQPPTHLTPPRTHCACLYRSTHGFYQMHMMPGTFETVIQPSSCQPRTVYQPPRKSADTSQVKAKTHEKRLREVTVRPRLGNTVDVLFFPMLCSLTASQQHLSHRHLLSVVDLQKATYNP